MGNRSFVAVGAMLASLLAWPSAAQNATTMIVMDGSGSMWGQIDGRPKLEIAREVAAQVLGTLPPDLELGLMAYGHRTRGDCGDIELIVPPAAGTGLSISDAIGRMRFQGKTPLTEAVRRAAEALRSTEVPATVVLVTDGIETCDADPCALAIELKRSGVAFTAHVVGFGLSRDQGAQVACIADNTGGRYIQADDADGLADALTAAVTQAEPPAETLVPPAPRPRHFPGAELMPDIALAPTGFLTGEERPPPERRPFPEDGTIAQCRAVCEDDTICGSWVYEPRGSFFVDHARCATFSPATEFWTHAYPQGEGWASGMKPGVLGLLRPYVPIGSTDVHVRLRVPEPVEPGAEFTVLWEGPGEDGDRIDLAPAGHEDLWSERNFRVDETIEPGDLPEGAGTLTAPVEPGAYELRYVFTRSVDERILLRVPLTVGGGGPGTPASAESPDAGLDPSMLVEATFEADTDGLELGVQWSAAPVTGQNLPPEAWAPHDFLYGPVTEMFFPGEYDVRGDAGDNVFADRVRVTAQGPNRFLIPRSGALSPAGKDQPDGYSCPGPGNCRIDDPTGLSFTLPAGWQSDASFLAETAAGVRAERPTVTFTGPNGSPMLLLNPLQWLESNGVCTESAGGPLCIFGAPDGAALAAMSVILPSIAYEPASR